MSLPEFIAKITGFSERTESKLKEIAEAQSKLAGSEAQVSALKEKVSSLETSLATANKASAEQAEKILKLESDLAAEKSRANDVIASQGIDPSALPAAAAHKPEPAAPKQTAREKYQAMLQNDPRAAGKFYVENRDAIFAGK